MEPVRLNQDQKDRLSGGALGFGLQMLLYGVMMLPSLISSTVASGLAIKQAVDPAAVSAAPTTAYAADMALAAPRTYVRLSAVLSRSTITIR